MTLGRAGVMVHSAPARTEAARLGQDADERPRAFHVAFGKVSRGWLSQRRDSSVLRFYDLRSANTRGRLQTN